MRGGRYPAVPGEAGERTPSERAPTRLRHDPSFRHTFSGYALICCRTFQNALVLSLRPNISQGVASGRHEGTSHWIWGLAMLTSRTGGKKLGASRLWSERVRGALVLRGNRPAPHSLPTQGPEARKMTTTGAFQWGREKASQRDGQEDAHRAGAF